MFKEHIKTTIKPWTKWTRSEKRRSQECEATHSATRQVRRCSETARGQSRPRSTSHHASVDRRFAAAPSLCEHVPSPCRTVLKAVPPTDTLHVCIRQRLTKTKRFSSSVNFALANYMDYYYSHMVQSASLFLHLCWYFCCFTCFNLAFVPQDCNKH